MGLGAEPVVDEALVGALLLVGERGEEIATAECDELDTLIGQLGVESVAVVGLVADDAIGHCFGQHEVEELLHQVALGMIRGSRVDGGGKTLGIDQHHDLHAFTDSGQADSCAAALPSENVASMKHS